MASMGKSGDALSITTPLDWWASDYRHYDSQGVLRFAGRSVADLGRDHGTPTYYYSEARIAEKVALLQHALGQTGLPSDLYYAMKSNRHPSVLELLRTLGLGVDVCSPGEMRLALECGFKQENISFTGGCLSAADHEALKQVPRIWVNADSLSALRQIAKRSAGREIGLRINPGVGIGYGTNELLRYAGERPTKFGVYLDRFAEALELARTLGLHLTGLHCHAGCGYLTPQLPALAQVLDRVKEFLDMAPQVTRLNLGGGLGIPLVERDAPLELGEWADLVRGTFGGRKNLKLALEPGDFLVKDAGLLVVEVTQVEQKGGRLFVGANAGFNVHIEPAFYHLPLEAVPVVRRAGPPEKAAIVGNINEALDVWSDEAVLSPIEEGDLLAFLNAGGYGASMASQHCLRTEMREVYLPAVAAAERESESVDAGEVAQLEESNKRAWDRLYATTADLVWGREELPFLGDFSTALRDVFDGCGKLLDAGTGEGRNLPFLLRLGACEVHALDSSPHALAKILPALASRVSLRLGDLDRTGYSEGYFDGVLLMDVIETLPVVDKVLCEMKRILRPGGLLLCNIPGPDDGVAGVEMRPARGAGYLYRDNYYFEFRSSEEARALMTAAGFEIARIEKREWEELPHPGFRSTRHRHVSEIILARRVADIR